MRDIGIGIIGTGFMGQSHALAYRAAAGIYPDSLNPVLKVVADINEDALERARVQYGFERGTTDWKALVADPEVGIVSITTPNTLHREQALAAIAAGKHVHCEKPIAPSAADAREMMEAAEAAGVMTQVGYNYLKNPLLKLARQMVESGELGEITSFRGIHAEDYMADPQLPYSWRFDPAGGAGVLADLGSHIVGMARFLLGPISDLNADLETVIKERPIAPGSSETRAVQLDDIARLTVQFARGCKGSIEASWVATGRKMQLGFELVGSKGSLAFTQERFNELLYFKAGNDPKYAGYQRIEAGPQHTPYGHFCKAPGHQLGFNDLKTIEVAEFLQAIARGKDPEGPDFREAWEIQKVIDTAVLSSRERSWLAVP
ncbi:1-carboxy-3-chloro-3,4-dihydroxycyclo hexa-1,5-diene dehydrogenase [Marinobacterium nitratireducens]|uniref:1-carboxy-3-chloro-3,4-dihydroxycyclo hexa-1,5-diene dehydrogenase n=1 Tax=Marinobacterium nitratireducens TaxID=518897 RepID=A0A917ZLG5_9GAMM|nr:Gfo/Idh/MocA family oxidoreductase [Marinobacterium nitratireducens]GGO84383.1 1-carboxy-3-chloro-3,4-dihydroxycyclo hexa-1,5-diene dehydrogenase [Marinobacterium nitratireducens]